MCSVEVFTHNKDVFPLLLQYLLEFRDATLTDTNYCSAAGCSDFSWAVVRNRWRESETTQKKTLTNRSVKPKVIFYPVIT